MSFDFDELLTRPGAGVLLRPWFDRVTLSWMARVYYPLSRAWAAGLEAADVDDFAAAVPLDDPPSGVVRPALAFLRRRASALAEANEAWTEAAFLGDAGSGDTLAAAEAARESAAQAWMLARAAFVPLMSLSRLPATHWAIAPPGAVEARHGTRLAAPAAAFPSAEVPPIAETRRIREERGEMFWLRFRSPDAHMNDTAWARVFAPVGVRHPPTLIFLHGVSMETEFYMRTSDPVNALCEDGIRVVRPEGPWHGRRRLAGRFGGEPVFALGPLGLVELFAAWLAELSVLIAWARATSRGPVAIGGLSLGALASQLAASAACSWPAERQPDVLLLAATSGDLMDVTLTGSLPAALGLPDRLAEAGWSRQKIARWLPLVAPGPEPVMDAERIVMLLGESDDVTPFAGGRALAERWRVPQENRFLNDRGHFTVLMGLNRDRAPLARLRALLSDRRH